MASAGRHLGSGPDPPTGSDQARGSPQLQITPLFLWMLFILYNFFKKISFNLFGLQLIKLWLFEG